MMTTTRCSSTTTSLSIGGNAISSAIISSEILLVGKNQLTICFFDSRKMEISKIVFEFLPVKSISGSNLISFFNEILRKGTYKIADVYPLNGTAKRGTFSITDFVRPIHRKEIQQHVEKLKDAHDYVRLMVIDFKDSSIAYVNRDEILKTEEAFAKFLREAAPTGKNADTQAKIHKLIRENGIDFIINEGKLKADLLIHTFTDPAQKAFIQNKDNSQLFCQLCEVMMNGFKKGEEIVVNGIHYHPNDYITVLNAPSFIYNGQNPPDNQLLQTYYPGNYKDTYSKDGLYYSLINKISKVGYHYDNIEKITTITIQ